MCIPGRRDGGFVSRSGLLFELDFCCVGQLTRFGNDLINCDRCERGFSVPVLVALRDFAVVMSNLPMTM
jgi:hypothetical protein